MRGHALFQGEIIAASSNPVCLFKYSFADVWFVGHLSWKPKWAFLIACSPALSVHFSHFRLLLKNHWVNFNQTWHKAPLGGGHSRFFLNKGLRPFRRGDYNEIAKLHWRTLKIVLSRTTGPTAIKLSTNILG